MITADNTSSALDTGARPRVPPPISPKSDELCSCASVPAENRKKLGILDGFIRLSVGIEDVEDLRGDLERSFAAAR